MASTFKINSQSYGGRYMYVSCSQTKDIATNTSKIAWTLVVTGGNSNYYSTEATTVKINGVTVYYKGYTGWSSYEFPAAKGSVSGETSVAHDNNGDATITVSITTGIHTGVSETNSGSWTLDSIPRQATIDSAPNFNDEENPTIKYSNPAGSSVTSLQACISLTGANADIAYRNLSKTGTSYTFTLTNAERNLLRNATLNGSTTRNVVFKVKTVISGNEFISSATKTFTVVNAAPDLSALVMDTNAATVALTGDSLTTLVSGYSNAAYEMIAQGLKGASITEYKAVNGGITKTTSSGAFNKTENATFTFTVKDNRGQTATKNIGLTLIKYFKPTCNAEVELALDTETTVRANIKVNGTFFNGSFGYKNNSLTAYIKHSGAADWVNLNDVFIEPTINGNNYSLDFGISNLDYTAPFTYQIKVVDALEEVLSAEDTVSYNPVFDWGAEDFNFNVPVTIQGNALNDFVIETGTEAMGSNGTWFWRKWASGIAECYGVRNYGNMAVNTAWGSVYVSSTFTQALPTNLFIENPSYCSVMYAGSSSDWNAWIILGTIPTKTVSTGFCVARPEAGTISQAKISFNVIGRWKA